MKRREFLRGTMLAAASAGVRPGLQTGLLGHGAAPAPRLIDVNVNLSRWPFRRLRGDDPAALTAMLARQGVDQAWASSFDGLLHKDVDGVNRRLAAQCRRVGDGRLVPFGVVNPMLPDWEEDVRRVHEVYGMPGVRLFPNYHLYTLADPICERMLSLTAERGLIVQVPVLMEDVRTQHPLVRVPPVDFEPLVPLLRRLPSLRLVVLNNRSEVSLSLMRRLMDAGAVYADLARADGTGVVGAWLEALPTERLLYGTYAPYLYPEAAQLKMKESALTEAQAQAIRVGNALNLRPTAAAASPRNG